MVEVRKQSSDVAKSEGGAVEPRRALSNLQGEINRVFEDFMGPWRGWHLPRRLFEPFEGFERDMPSFKAMSPEVDLTETDDALKVTAELPGLGDKDIEVIYADGALTLKGEKKEEREETKKDYYMSERRYGSFQRTFRLPAEVDENRIAAEFKNGVLTVTLPKTPSAKSAKKKIKVKAG